MFRKDKLEKLKNENPLEQAQKAFLLSKDSTYFKNEERTVNLLMKVDNEKDEKDLYFLAENLKERKDFELTGLYSSEDFKTFSDTLYSKTLTRFSTSPETNFFQGDNRFILLKNDLVRSTYGSTQEDFNNAYEETVILLPLKKRDKLILIRDNEK